jgi:hypothetical protein
MTRTRTPETTRPPWVVADYLLGFLLGLALGAMAIDHGARSARDARPTHTGPSYALPLRP